MSDWMDGYTPTDIEPGRRITLGASVSEDVAELFEKIARGRGLKKGVLLRGLIEEYVRRNS